MKLPAFQFYPADWKKDIKVQSLSFEERGIWFEILCLMHESEERGKLVINKKPMDEEMISRLISCEISLLQQTLKKILFLRVAYKDKNGIIFNKRMVNDEKIIKIRRKCGKKGGNPKLVKRSTDKQYRDLPTDKSEENILLNQNPNQTGKQKTTPSFASSSSSSNISSKQVFEFLRTATLPSISDRQIYDEVEKLIDRYSGTNITNLRAVCNSWANNLKPEKKKLVV